MRTRKLKFKDGADAIIIEEGGVSLDIELGKKKPTSDNEINLEAKTNKALKDDLIERKLIKEEVDRKGVRKINAD